MRVAAFIFILLAATVASASGRLDDFDCVACHPARDPVVFARLQSRGVAQPLSFSATEAVCRTCHNGSLVESRSRVGPKAIGHPTGLPGRKSSSGLFPLFSGKLECATCHTPHPENSTSLKRPGWLRAPASEPFPCSDCHADKAEHKKSHLGEKADAKAQAAVRSRGGAFGKKGEIVCATCHTAHAGNGRQLLIAPYGKEGEGTLCRLCHERGAGKMSHPVNTGGTHHEAEGFPFSESGAITCSTCHPPHGVKDESAALGFRAPSDGRSVCVPCHPEAKTGEFRHVGRELGAKAKTDATALGGRVASDNKVACLTCHSAHAGATPKLLVAPYFDGATKGLCATCHKVREVADKVGKGVKQKCSECHGHHGNPPPKAKPGQPVCLGCHEKRVGAAEHPTLPTVSCQSCHTIHKGDAASGWLINPKEGDAGCKGCHDTSTYSHAVGLKVEKADRKLLERRAIKLGKDGTVGCATCHVSHNAREGSLLAQSEEILCLYCHPKENPFGPEGLKPGAHPVGVDLLPGQANAIAREVKPKASASEKARSERFGKLLACSTCHRAHGNRTVASARCEECHSALAGIGSHREAGGCAACHPVHSETPPAATCAGCHAGKADTSHVATHQVKPGELPGVTKGVMTADKGELGCPTCHAPHSSAPKLLALENTDATCAACHPEKQSFAGGPHDLPDESGVKAGCRNCHPPHAKKADEREQGKRCLDCHDEGVVSGPMHSPEGTLGLWSRATGLPLFDNFGRKNEYGFVDCPTCHDVHQPAGKRAMRLPTTSVPSLCLVCHPEKQSLLGTPHDVSASGKDGGDAPCELCHSVHALGKMPPAWKLEAGAQGTLNDRKCSPCHGPPEFGARPRSGPQSHPVNAPLPREMNAKGLKLFTATGAPDGRTYACSTCHNIHGEMTEVGGRTEKFLRKNASDGGLCATCHEANAAVAGTAHDVAGGEKPLGPCSPCHMVHGAGSVGKLWGLEPFPEGLNRNRLCKSCHSRAEEERKNQSRIVLFSASENSPKTGQRLYHHMRDAEPAFTPRGTIYLQRPMIIWDENSSKRSGKPVIPLYNSKDEEDWEGDLACGSCHDPHRWSPENAAIKPSAIAKWQVTTKFLKLKNSAEAKTSVCAQCHKDRASEYYKRYHEVWSDVGK